MEFFETTLGHELPASSPLFVEAFDIANVAQAAR